MERTKIALISVYDKKGIEDFAKELVALNWQIVSSGGTAKYLKDAGIKVTDVAEITGMPPILDHRVVTLHPKILGGLLAENKSSHLEELEKYGIPFIDLVCVDFYPLEDAVNDINANHNSVIEKTDIGGPTMIRSGGKGGRITICDPADRQVIIKWLKDGEPNKEEFLNNLHAKAEIIISKYCSVSAEYHSNADYKGIFGKKSISCAYGENAYQTPASFYENLDRDIQKDYLGISNWKLVAGNPLSYNNICDLDRMIQTMTHIGAGYEKNFNKVPNIAMGVKHGNSCGIGVAESGIDAIDKMLQGDLRAIFGGSVMLNFHADEKIAEELIHKYVVEGRRLLDVVAGPSFSPEAIEILSRKKGKCRLIENSAILKAGLSSLDHTNRFRYVRGGFLTQPNYIFVPSVDNNDVILAWGIGCTSNSNTITLVKDGRLVGNGVGQQDRVGAAKLAIFRADDAFKFANQNEGTADLEGAVAYSDSFFPFPDAVEVLINRGVKTIFSTSGSVNDEKIIELCKSRGVSLIMLPDSEARGFYQH